MNGCWVDTSIGEQVTLQRGFDITKKNQRPGGVPVISSGGINSYHDTSMVDGPGVIIGRKGTLGTVFFVEHGYWPHDTTLWVKDFKGNAPLFVFYFLKSLSRQFFGMDVGSANPTLNRNHVHPLVVSWPESRGDQDEIAEILSSLDEKIELNRQQNRTLDAIAQALFKRWFVEFEFPFDFAQDKPDQNGQPYKSSGGAMQASELGEIPVGWEVKPLDQIAEYLNGLALQKFPPEGDEYLPVIKIREMKQGITTNSDKASTKLDPKYIIDDGDVLFSWSGSLVVDIWCHGKGALNQHLFKVSSDNYPKWFYYLWTKHHLRAFQAIAADKATTMGHIQRAHLTDALTVCPPVDELTKITESFEPLIEKMITNRVETRSLASLRDTLLPKLMSGELRVSDKIPVEQKSTNLEQPGAIYAQ